MNLALLILSYDLEHFSLETNKEIEIYTHKECKKDASPIFGRMFVYLFECNL